MKNIYCDICTSVLMKLKSASHVTKGVNTYRIRKFYCGICGYEKSVYADGYKDEVLYPNRAIKDSRELTEQDKHNEERPDIYETT